MAHDVGLHKYWVVRISAKNPHKPPDLNRIPSRDKITKVWEKIYHIILYHNLHSGREIVKKSADLVQKKLYLG